jgi:L-amino acid N-acyltransferase YncA
MSKIVKIKQEDIETIVNNIVSEQVNEESHDLEEQPQDNGEVQIFLGKDENGVVYVINAKTGDILGSKDMSGKISGLESDQSDIRMAAE